MESPVPPVLLPAQPLQSFVGISPSTAAARFATRAMRFSSFSCGSSSPGSRDVGRPAGLLRLKLENRVRRGHPGCPSKPARPSPTTAGSFRATAISCVLANSAAAAPNSRRSAAWEPAHAASERSAPEPTGEEPRVAVGTSLFVAHGLFDAKDLASRDASWQAEEHLPDLHAAGLLGSGQVVGLGDTGVNVESCAFADEHEKVSFNSHSATHRKIVSYYTLNGDAKDGASGHGSHVAGCIAANASAELGLAGRGLAPGAKLAIVDVEKSSKTGVYNVPHKHIGAQYFDLFRAAGASAVCSPWGFSSYPKLEAAVDAYAYQHQDFLPVFPSGNTFDSKSKAPVSPCGAKNVLCVGASYNAQRSYLSKPSFVNAALKLANGEELPIVPAAFGATTPLDEKQCEATVEVCLASQAACPACAFDVAALSLVSEAPVEQASPSDACSPLSGFSLGRVCLVYRGDCNFETKAKHCKEAGASGVLVVNTAGSQEIVMVAAASGSSVAASLAELPIALISQPDASKLLSHDPAVVTFPVVSEALSQLKRAPYSSYGKVSGNKHRPEMLFPGDNVLSTDSHSPCGLVVLSGTSQSCGIAVGSIALVREYLQSHANPRTARLGRPAAATLRAVLAASARTPDVSRVLEEDQGYGYGLPRLAGILNMTDTARLTDFAALHIVEAEALRGESLKFCFNLQQPLSEALRPPAVALAWTDLPEANGRLVNNLNLRVDCIKSAWSKWGNSDVNLYSGDSPRSATADIVSTVEKVSLYGLSSPDRADDLCIVTVNFVEGQTSTSMQKFSLVLTGPLALTPGCELRAPARTPASTPASTSASTSSTSLSSVQAWQLCGENGTATSAWTCSCRAGWYGPLCSLRPTSVPAGETRETTARPWQWDLSSLPLCGAGSYRFQVSSETSLDDLLLFASGAPEPSALFDTSSVAAATSSSSSWSSSLSSSSSSATWSEAGATFALQRTSKAISLSLTTSGDLPDVLYLTSFNLRHGGALTYSLQWKEAPSACHLPGGTSLRGSTGGSGLRVVVGLALALFSLCTAAFAFLVGLRLRRRRGPGYRHKSVGSIAASPDEVVSESEGPATSTRGRCPSAQGPEAGPGPGSGPGSGSGPAGLARVAQPQASVVGSGSELLF